jgi:pyruvate formate lyase activating enzyme
VFKLAKKEGLYNTYVSNGYMTEEVLKDLVDAGLDAINIDLKGSKEMVKKYCGADVEKVWRNAKLAKNLGVHVEITTLLIDNLNSEKEVVKDISERILIELGEYTPFHITRFYPQYKSNKHEIYHPTSKDLMHNAYKIAKDVGLQYVYLGNLLGSGCEDTICPNCSETVIKRAGFGVYHFSIDSEGNCSGCGFPICIM